MRKSITIEYEAESPANGETVVVRLACGAVGFAWTEGEALQKAIAAISAVDDYKLVEMQRKFS